MRHLSFRPALTLQGREFRGLRGWAGKPLHPPLTDIPVGAYTLAAAFDVISALGHDHPWARDFYRAASFCLIAGVIVALLAALTGFWDWLQGTEPGTQVRRSVNAHAWTMIVATLVVLGAIAVRALAFWDEPSTPGVALALTLAAALITALGGTIGGSLAYDYGFNVVAAADEPVWHRSEQDTLPGDEHRPAPPTPNRQEARPGRTSPAS
jgi:uncharacterized membrane protein